jgi:hypothetical protein
MNDLVERLSLGKHSVVFEKQSKKMQEIQTRLIELKFVFVKFINTRGGTELGINVEDSLTCFKDANFENGTGNIHVVGWCVLNYHKVRCIADVDLATREGIGYIELFGDSENAMPTTKH